jgi:Holliday junction resolvase-like predicted endonuclease
MSHPEPIVAIAVRKGSNIVVPEHELRRILFAAEAWLAQQAQRTNNPFRGRDITALTTTKLLRDAVR